MRLDAEEFLNKEYKKEFNTKQLLDGIDVIHQEILINLMNKFGNKLNESTTEDNTSEKATELITDVSDLLIAWEQYKKANWWESDAIDVEKVLMKQFAAIYSR